MYPINEQISRQILTTLKGVTVEAGYGVTLKAQRATRPPPPAEKLLAVLYEGDDVVVDDGSGDGGGAIGLTTWLRPYAVLVYAMGAESDTEPYDALLNLARASVEKALVVDTSRGGLARNTILQEPTKVEDQNEPPAVQVNFVVLYSTNQYDPFKQS